LVLLLIPLHFARSGASENQESESCESGDFLGHLADFNCDFGAELALLEEGTWRIS
jgi:hypothetical protein